MKNKTHQKRVAAIHDLSGFGKCSLTVALPILSAAGIEAAALPTAILSTHTGGISGYTYRDLTNDMRPIMKHWKSLDLKFDAIYTGFLGSFEQQEIVKEFFDMFRRDDNLILVDPVMGDNGELYTIFTREFAAGMRSLCEKADIIVPNLTEAALLLDEPFSALDAKIRQQMREELKKIQSDLGITVVFVTHDQEEAMSISDMIVVMKLGVVQQIGKPQEVYDDPNGLSKHALIEPAEDCFAITTVYAVVDFDGKGLSFGDIAQ